jgi:RNA-binding protein
MSDLTSPQRKFLRSQAHHLEPIVLVGKHGITDQVVASANQALDARELIKVRFNDHKDRKKALSEELRARTNSHIAGILGHVLILYRPQEDETKRRITLP